MYLYTLQLKAISATAVIATSIFFNFIDSEAEQVDLILTL